ncbi:MAG: GHMP kinase [Euryarchaeota archaeon]|nr:GHMP kinase [Euryarchaeota archaeon]
MKCSVFVPSHITGFFEIVDHKDPLKKGSRGAGVVLDRGVITRVKINSSKDNVIIKINGKKNPEESPITRKTVDLMKKEFELENKLIKIDHMIQVPIGAGFGVSAAFALGTSFGIARALNLPVTHNKAASIAHLAEIEMKSGLGDVISELHGGIVLRLKEGAPGIGMIDKLISSQWDDLYIVTKTLGGIDTASIIGDPVLKKKINDVGRNLLFQLLKTPTPQKFMELSRKFAESTSLMSEDVQEMVEILNDESLGASMAMLGNTAFAISESLDTSLDDTLIAKIDGGGIRFIK